VASHREREMTTPNDAAGTAFLEGAIAAVSGDGGDEAREALVVIRDLRERKLWHELTLAIERAVAPPVSETIRARVSGGLRGLYEGVVREVETRLNPLKTAHVAVAVSDAFGEGARGEAMEFLTETSARLVAAHGDEAKEPEVYISAHVTLLKLMDGDLDYAKRAVTSDDKEALEALAAPDPSVSAAFHYVASRYHKVRENYAEFYKSGMLYLAYVSCELLPTETRVALSVDLCLAALLGENVYNFAELLAHPIVESISDGPFAWLMDVVKAFNEGDLHKYDELCVKHATSLNAQPALVANERKLREKITILSLLQIIFHLPADHREISLSDIAAKTKLTIDGVEYLLMKALSVHLIEGIIDQVESKVTVTWVQPRVLLRSQIAELANRLDGWIEKVSAVETNLAEEIAV
jgi:26S proteasome regulatory subunit N9